MIGHGTGRQLLHREELGLILPNVLPAQAVWRRVEVLWGLPICSMECSVGGLPRSWDLFITARLTRLRQAQKAIRKAIFSNNRQPKRPAMTERAGPLMQPLPSIAT